jgi:hypothetical protein
MPPMATLGRFSFFPGGGGAEIESAFIMVDDFEALAIVVVESISYPLVR